MPITLSDEALSRWIAEKIEPMPTKRPNWSHAESATKVWVSAFKGYYRKAYPPNQEGYPEAWYGWKVRDMVNDPAMTVMLMERAGIGVEPTTNGFDGKRQDCWQAYPLDFSKDPLRIYAFTGYGSIGRAVAEAFALANGYHEEPL